MTAGKDYCHCTLKSGVIFWKSLLKMVRVSDVTSVTHCKEFELRVYLFVWELSTCACVRIHVPSVIHFITLKQVEYYSTKMNSPIKR